MQTNPDTSAQVPAAVIIPSYNPGSRLPPVLKNAQTVSPHIVVVDDGSTDGSANEAAALGAEVLRLPVNQGKGHALIAGLRHALNTTDYVAFALMDADGQHDPAELPRLFEVFQAEQADLLIGARQFQGVQVPWASRFGNTMTIWVATRLLGQKLPDTQCGYRILSRAFAEAVVAQLHGGRYETEMEMLVMAGRGGWKLASAPIRTIYEAGNPSSHFRKLADSWRIYRKILALAFRR